MQKDRKTAILNSQNIRMLQTHVNNDIYNKYCLLHNNSTSILPIFYSSSSQTDPKGHYDAKDNTF